MTVPVSRSITLVEVIRRSEQVAPDLALWYFAVARDGERDTEGRPRRTTAKREPCARESATRADLPADLYHSPLFSLYR